MRCGIGSRAIDAVVRQQVRPFEHLYAFRIDCIQSGDRAIAITADQADRVAPGTCPELAVLAIFERRLPLVRGIRQDPVKRVILGRLTTTVLVAAEQLERQLRNAFGDQSHTRLQRSKREGRLDSHQRPRIGARPTQAGQPAAAAAGDNLRAKKLFGEHPLFLDATARHGTGNGV
jgi:hypothetical protein